MKMREVARADDETTALKKQVADLQKQLAKLSLQVTKTAPSAEEQPTGTRPTGWTVAQRTQPTRKDFACFNCGDHGHAVRYCPYPPTTAPPIPTNAVGSTQPTSRANQPVQPIHNRSTLTSIIVMHKKHRLSALIDTGSDITIIGDDFAKKCRWKNCELKEVKGANDGDIVIRGRARERITVGNKTSH